MKGQKMLPSDLFESGGLNVNGSQSPFDTTIAVRLFGGRPNEIDGSRPEDFVEYFRESLVYFGDNSTLYGDLAERAKVELSKFAALPPPQSLVDLRPLAESCLPLIREAVSVVQQMSDEWFEIGKDAGLTRKGTLERLRLCVTVVERLLQILEEEPTSIEVERTITIKVTGKESDVSALIASAEALVMNKEQESLVCFSENPTVKLSQDSDGYIVVLRDGEVWETETEITESIRDALGPRLLSMEDGLALDQGSREATS